MYAAILNLDEAEDEFRVQSLSSAIPSLKILRFHSSFIQSMRFV